MVSIDTAQLGLRGDNGDVTLHHGVMVSPGRALGTSVVKEVGRYTVSSNYHVNKTDSGQPKAPLLCVLDPTA